MTTRRYNCDNCRDTWLVDEDKILRSCDCESAKLAAVIDRLLVRIQKLLASDGGPSMSVKTFEVPGRAEIAKRVLPKLEDGDILVRLSDTRGPLGIPFSKWVADLSQSRWSHSALFYWDEAGAARLLEISDRGTTDPRFVDWLDFCVGGEFEVYRRAMITPEQQREVKALIFKYRDLDPGYDFNLDREDLLYCVESVCQIYKEVGLPLMEPMLLKQIIKPSIYPFFVAGNAAMKVVTGKGYNLAQPNYFVGNKKVGLLASPLLDLVTSVRAP